jgi:hypothetical protein
MADSEVFIHILTFRGSFKQPRFTTSGGCSLSNRLPIVGTDYSAVALGSWSTSKEICILAFSGLLTGRKEGFLAPNVIQRKIPLHSNRALGQRIRWITRS